MGQVLHGSATTTAAVRWAIQQSQESLNRLAVRYDINPKTVAKWKKRTHVDDAPMGPKQPRSTVLPPDQEAACVAFRKHTVLPLDDCLYALQHSIPALTRSSLHRLFQRHDISRLPEMDGEKPAKKKFKKYPIGYFHLDIAAVRTEEGKLYLFVAIDRTSKFAYAELHAQYGKMEAAQFLRNLIAAVPYKIHTILTDNGIQFTNRKTDRHAFPHIFARVCLENDTEHRLTKPNHPWTNGQVERMNRTLKEATVKRYYYENHLQLKEHLHNFMNAYNVAKRLKALQGLTPYEYIIKSWQNESHRFLVNPIHHKVGLNKDLFTCEVVRHAMGARMTTDLVSHAFRNAVETKRPRPGLIHHSDRESQYCAQDYQEQLRQFGMTASMSRKGSCYDNAPMESFWGTLKNELVHHRRYATREQARREITEYIELFYNRQRRHSRLGNCSPAAFAQQWARQ